MSHCLQRRSTLDTLLDAWKEIYHEAPTDKIMKSMK